MDFLGGSFWIGRLAGINVRVHFLFLLYLAFNLLDAGQSWQFELGFFALLFGIVLLHEFGHCFGARSVGGDASEILLWPLGGLAFARAPMTPWAQFVTVACGPLVNLVFCLLSAGMLIALCGTWEILNFNPLRPISFAMIDGLDAVRESRGLTGLPDWLPYVGLFYDLNLMLLAFNLLPIYPMDGGQLFQIAMWPAMGLQRSTIIACQVGIAGAIGLAVWGLTRGSGGLLIMMAIFGGMTCFQRLQAAKYGALIDERGARFEPVGRVRRKRSGGFFGSTARRETEDDGLSSNPNPGGWESKQRAEAERDAEIDRILQKVHEHGITSLTYVERQALERATRERNAGRP